MFCIFVCAGFSFCLICCIAGSCFISNGLLIGCNGSIVFFIFISTSLLFCKVILIQLVCNSSNIFIDCIETIGYILIYLLNNFILCCISAFAFCSFLCNSLIAGSCFIGNSLLIGCNVLLVGGNVRRIILESVYLSFNLTNFLGIRIYSLYHLIELLVRNFSADSLHAQKTAACENQGSCYET